jgi:hypothetical protein
MDTIEAIMPHSLIVLGWPVGSPGREVSIVHHVGRRDKP